MAIQTAHTALQDFVKKASTLAPGTTKKRADPRFFELMVQRGSGINGELAGPSANPQNLDPNVISGLEMLASGQGSDQDAALSMLGYQSSANALTGERSGMDQFQGRALATLSRLAMEQAAEESAKPAASSPGGSSVRRAVNKSAVRMVVNRSARHPDDLGHLRNLARPSRLGGFTRREEKLLLAAAGVENLMAERAHFAAPPRVRMPSHTPSTTPSARSASRPRVLPSSLQRAGQLSAQYESNNAIDCIGYDRCGGTSYGQYQIASRTGTMGYFIRFLENAAPDIAAQLKAAGPANTGGRSGRMPAVWKAVAARDPKRFEALQHEFIRANSYAPAAKSIVLTTGVDVTRHSYALREVLWSTAVQHGPGGAERIFTQAIEKAGVTLSSQDFDKAVIEEVYRIRGRQFFRHSKRIREAVRSRFQDEKTTALAMLDGGPA